TDHFPRAQIPFRGQLGDRRHGPVAKHRIDDVRLIQRSTAQSICVADVKRPLIAFAWMPLNG
ncbi:MAG: hypothetical protein ACRD2I_14070, partial [Vicinamibacterales bacterium]